MRPVFAALVLGIVVLGTPTAVIWVFFDHLEGPFPIVAFAFPIVLMGAVAGIVSPTLRWGQRRGIGTFPLVLLIYVLSGVDVAILGSIYYALTRGVPGLESFGKDAGLARVVVDGFMTGPFAAAVWALVFEMPRAIEETRLREQERQELEREAERARVRAALEPHFVLNSLNAIGGLIGDSPETARQLIGDLGDLLRDAVRLSERAAHSAANELAWIERYARVLEARHRGRLTVECHLDRLAGSMELPVLLLQPLVENAIQHGALSRAGGGRVRVEASRDGRHLRCVVEDDGPGMPQEIRAGARGLALTRRRLDNEAPGSAMTLESSPRGTRIVVAIPGA